MFITLYTIGGVHFRLLGTNGFHVKAKNERFNAASSRCRQNLKYENFTGPFGRPRQNMVPKSVPHVQHDYFSSFNQSNHWFVALWLALLSSNLKLPITELYHRRQKRSLQRYKLKLKLLAWGKLHVEHAWGVHGARTRAVLFFFCKTTTWNFYTCGLDDGVNIQQQILTSIFSTTLPPEQLKRVSLTSWNASQQRTIILKVRIVVVISKHPHCARSVWRYLGSLRSYDCCCRKENVTLR